MREVVIAKYLRTAQSRSRPSDPSRDWLHPWRADDLLAALLPEVLRRSGVESEELDDFIVGSAIGVSEQWTYGGRTPVFLANLSEKVPAKFVDQQCGSGMAAVHIGFLEIAAGFADVVLAAGMEHMSRVPMGPTLFDKGVVSLNERLSTEEAYGHWDMDTTMNMGMTAEKLLSLTSFTREDMDRWSARSHQRAAKALESGFLAGEILPLDVEQADGAVLRVERDQSVRAETTLEALSRLKPVFLEGGAVTAGNSSPLNAGASAMVLMSRERAEQKGIEPLAVVRSMGVAGVDPTVMGAGPVPAVGKALDKAGLTVEEMDFWEINEAFSIVVLNCMRELGIQEDKVNVMGGAIALGHPLGATGIRILGTLARILHEKGGRYGCAAACIGGGQGIATIIERA